MALSLVLNSALSVSQSRRSSWLRSPFSSDREHVWFHHGKDNTRRECGSPSPGSAVLVLIFTFGARRIRLWSWLTRGYIYCQLHALALGKVKNEPADDHELQFQSSPKTHKLLTLRHVKRRRLVENTQGHSLYTFRSLYFYHHTHTHTHNMSFQTHWWNHVQYFRPVSLLLIA